MQLGLKNWDLDDSLDTFKEELKTYIGPIFKQEDPIFYQPKKEPQDIVIPKNQRSSVPSLGNITVAGTAPVSQQVVSVVNPLAGMIQGTGLTASENALLSNEEKSIRMRQKGIIS